MLGTFTTADGFRLEVFSSMYMDWGLCITREGEELFYNPHCLSNESYGRKPARRFDGDWEAAEEWDFRATPEQQAKTPAWVEWTAADWREALEAEADDLIEAFVPDAITTAQKEG